MTAHRYGQVPSEERDKASLVGQTPDIDRENSWGDIAVEEENNFEHCETRVPDQLHL